MKTVRLQNNTVAEIIPEYALPVEKWYGADFAAQCLEAPDDVRQGMVYDPETGTFSEPDPEPLSPTPDPEADRDAMLVDLEYRMTLLELGVN